MGAAGVQASVIVVSWQRPDALRRCLYALRQQDHVLTEIVVVADAQACAQTRADMEAGGWAVKIADNPGGNISQARNTGLALAAGEIVAFIDDDAVAEPSWLSRLVAALAPGPEQVITATGFTRGRNGFSFQWTACEVSATGEDIAIAPARQSGLHQGHHRQAVKPVGTNCAFHRASLMRAGGFDEAYRFYLDDADVALRLAKYGKTAIVPDAQVHHGFEPSPRRRADRVPLSLHEIGASAMVFLRRHATEREWAAALDRLRRDQRRRMLRHMIAGRIEPRDVDLVLHTLETGIAEGAVRVIPALHALPDDAAPPFLPLTTTGPKPGRLIAGRIWQTAALHRSARRLAEHGIIVTVLILSPTPRRHQSRYHRDGYWIQTGGLFGAADRREQAFKTWNFDARRRFEAKRWAKFRPIAES